MSFEALLDLHAAADCEHSLRRWFSEQLPDTAAYAGCVSVTAMQDEVDAGHIVVVGQWDSRHHWERYMAWRKERGDLAALAPLLSRPPVFTCFERFFEQPGRR